MSQAQSENKKKANQESDEIDYGDSQLNINQSKFTSLLDNLLRETDKKIIQDKIASAAINEIIDKKIKSGEIEKLKNGKFHIKAGNDFYELDKKQLYNYISKTNTALLKKRISNYVKSYNAKKAIIQSQSRQIESRQKINAAEKEITNIKTRLTEYEAKQAEFNRQKIDTLTKLFEINDKIANSTIKASKYTAQQIYNSKKLQQGDQSQMTELRKIEQSKIDALLKIQKDISDSKKDASKYNKDVLEKKLAGLIAREKQLTAEEQLLASEALKNAMMKGFSDLGSQINTQTSVINNGFTSLNEETKKNAEATNGILSDINNEIAKTTAAVNGANENIDALREQLRLAEIARKREEDERERIRREKEEEERIRREKEEVKKNEPPPEVIQALIDLRCPADLVWGWSSISPKQDFLQNSRQFNYYAVDPWDNYSNRDYYAMNNEPGNWRCISGSQGQDLDFNEMLRISNEIDSRIYNGYSWASHAMTPRTFNKYLKKVGKPQIDYREPPYNQSDSYKVN